MIFADLSTTLCQTICNPWKPLSSENIKKSLSCLETLFSNENGIRRNKTCIFSQWTERISEIEIIQELFFDVLETDQVDMVSYKVESGILGKKGRYTEFKE